MNEDSAFRECRVAGANVPSYAHSGDAGADLKSSIEVIIPARSRKLIPTGIHLAIPKGYAGLIWPRSGSAVHHGIDCGAGVIDSQYRGEIKILLFNHSDQDFRIQPGDRIGQLLIQKVERMDFIRVESLDSTNRGGNGFGSTGK